MLWKLWKLATFAQLKYRQISQRIIQRHDLYHIPPEDSGSVLSLALKLRNRNMGTSQTHVAKNVAMSAKPGACGVFEGAP